MDDKGIRISFESHEGLIVLRIDEARALYRELSSLFGPQPAQQYLWRDYGPMIYSGDPPRSEGCKPK